MRAIVVAALIGLAGAGVAMAQGTSAPGPGSRYAGSRMYDPSTVTTVSGEVSSVQQFQRGRGQGVHLLLKSKDGDVEILLGPAWYLDQQKFTIAAGDRVDVTGSKVRLASGPAIVAAQVVKGDAKLQLRDANGVPVWAGRGPRGGRR